MNSQRGNRRKTSLPTSNRVKLLIVTQAIDTNDPILGFFHRWVEEFARHCESVIAACLFEGKHQLPQNVRVLSLGKESGPSRFKYTSRFFRLIWQERRNYDAVFVHQNQEYVLIAGFLWKLLGKKIYLWRNHYAGSLLTSIAVALSDAVFCTSRHSYTARYKKTVLMPVGVDLERFHPSAVRKSRSILFLGRVAPSKHPDVLVKALGILKKDSIEFSASLSGPVSSKDEEYRTSLMRTVGELYLADNVSFREGVSHAETPKLYASHEIFVNLSDSGMYDKTLFEAAASGCIVVSRSDDFRTLFDPRFTFDGSAGSLANRLSAALELPNRDRDELIRSLHSIAENNSLRTLMQRLVAEMSK